MKQVNSVCLLVVATSSFAAIVTRAGAQDAGFARDRTPTTIGRVQERFAPLGLPLGAFMLNASVGAEAYYTSNAKYTAINEEDDTVLVGTPSVVVNSRWSRHAINFGAKATARKYSNFEKENTTDWALFSSGRLDVSGKSRFMSSINLARGTEGRDSNMTFGVAQRPTRTNVAAANLIYETEFNRLRFRASTDVRKEKYNGFVQLTPTSVFNQHVRDITYSNVDGRLDYGVSPDTSVYVYGAFGKREYETDKTGDSEGTILAVGSSFDLSRLITGEAEVGTEQNKYKTLGTKESNTYYRSNVVWSPTPLTTVTGKLSRRTREAVAAGTAASSVGTGGVLSTTGSVTVDHELLRNVLLTASVSRTRDAFNGKIVTGMVISNINREDTRDDVSAKAVYYISNRVAFNGEIRHEKLDSSGVNAGRTYKNNVVRVGLTLNY
jgi:hypothetical protein